MPRIKAPGSKDGLGDGPSRAMECYTTPDGLIMPHQGEMAGRVEDGCVARNAVRADEVSDGS